MENIGIFVRKLKAYKIFMGENMEKLCFWVVLSCFIFGTSPSQADDFFEPIEFKVPYEKQDDRLELESLEQVDVQFSEEALEFLRFLEARIKNAKTSRLSSRGLGVSLMGVGVGLAPITLGLSLLYTGLGPVFIVSGEDLKKDLNGWRLIKASYVHFGYNNPSPEKLKKHDKRIALFIKKYLEKEPDEQTIELVAKAIVMANEKGWFGMLYNGSVIFGQDDHRGDISKKLFVEEGLNPKLLHDSPVKDKIAKYADAIKEYHEKKQEIIESLN